MLWFFATLVVLAMGGIAMVAAGRGEPLQDVDHDRVPSRLPTDRTLGPDDLRRVRFPMALRGYRMADVDALLDRLAREHEAAREARGEGPTP
ncbi:DivIVA domain-containing protein [Nocardioides sp. SYSU DS0663]|uniref:DivIVA domain-containing protein n=1 Tax=Nocardioides sp. SYSU DS0663 TaxID=3416445 RepID=UPI003F4C18E9